MKRYNITVNGKAYDVAVEEVGGSTAAAPVAAAPVAAAPAASAPAAAPVADGTKVTAPMPEEISRNDPLGCACSQNQSDPSTA